MGSRAVNRHRRFVWIEFEDPRDGIAFNRTMSSTEVGWRNLLFDLPPDKRGQSRIDAANPTLNIGWVAAKDFGRALIMRPKVDHSKFLGEWLLNPGVKKERGAGSVGSKLTFADDFTDQADFVAVSGHGAGGMIWGKASGGDIGDGFEIANEMGKHLDKPTTGRIKYLLLPCCFLVSIHNAESWLPILRKNKPLHGVLGYGEKYLGDSTGAAVTRRFASLLKSNLTMPIFEAWRRANEAVHQPWGAVILNAARKDNMKQWITEEGLPDLSAEKEVRCFDGDSMPDGEEVTGKPKDIEAFFVMADGSLIQSPMNRPANDLMGLFPGKSGEILLRVNKKDLSFQPDSHVTILFYYFRPAKTEMDLDGLLTFDRVPGARLRFLTDANARKEKKTGKHDAIEYTFLPGQEKEARIRFTISENAHKVYKDDENGHFTHGLFWMAVFPQGLPLSDPRKAFTMYKHGAWLRDPVKKRGIGF